MSETIVVALISVFGVVSTALLGVIGGLVNRTRQHAKAASDHASTAAHQTQNDHSTNLREDIDSKHTQVLGAIGQIHLVIAALDGRVSDVEDTLPGRAHFKPQPRKGRH